MMIFKLPTSVSSKKSSCTSNAAKQDLSSHTRACSLWWSKGACWTLIPTAFNPANGYVGAGSLTMSYMGAALRYQEWEMPPWVNSAEMLNPKRFGFIWKI